MRWSLAALFAVGYVVQAHAQLVAGGGGSGGDFIALVLLSNPYTGIPFMAFGFGVLIWSCLKPTPPRAPSHLDWVSAGARIIDSQLARFADSSRWDWRGSYTGTAEVINLGEHPTACQLVMHIVDAQATVSGDGSDAAGPFSVSGLYSVHTDRIAFTKTYLRSHCVEYRGAFIDGSLRGDWTIRRYNFHDSGTFVLRPVLQAAQSMALVAAQNAVNSPAPGAAPPPPYSALPPPYAPLETESASSFTNTTTRAASESHSDGELGFPPRSLLFEPADEDRSALRSV